MMKRVLAILLCLALSLGMLLACGNVEDIPTGDSTQDSTLDSDNGSGNGNGNDNTGAEGHTHTFKTDEEWTMDDRGHWYAQTCDCDDVEVRILNHTDTNNDMLCDVCKYVIDGHEHTYSEEWTADCTNHWHAADCGCIIAGEDVAEHVDETGDGECDECGYVIEDLHNHYFATEWSYADGYHWHAALCEHGVEVADKAPCTVNDAGYCTVCDNKVVQIDLTNILAVLKAAVANNYKVMTGNVVASQNAYEGSVVESGGTNEVFFVLGEKDSYVKWGSLDKAGNFIGVDQYWFETLGEGEIFGVQMPYYHPNTGVRNNEIELFPVSGNADKLNGYTYIPGAILSAGYENNNTLAQTLYNLYDILVKGENVSNAVTNYDAETGTYSFSYGYFFVNEIEGSTGMGGSGEDVTSYTVELFEVSVEFTLNDDYVVDFADFTVKSYRNLTGVDEDITYDPVTNTVTMLPAADPTEYNYVVSQTSGKRDYVSIYTKGSLTPTSFELTLVTDYVNEGVIVINKEESINGALVVEKGKYVILHITSLVPSTALASIMDMDDFKYSFVNKTEGETGAPWMFNPNFSKYSSTIAFSAYYTGTYELTFSFGKTTTTLELVINEKPVVVPPDTADTKYVQVTDTYAWVDEYTFTASKTGTYTFVLPAGLGLVWEGNLKVDSNAPGFDANVTHSVAVDLVEGEEYTFAVSSTKKGVYAISFSVKTTQGGGNEGGDTPSFDYATVIVVGKNTLYFSRDELAADSATRTITITTEGDYQFKSDLFAKSVVDALGNTYTRDMEKYTYHLPVGEYTVTFSNLSNFGIEADTATLFELIDKTEQSGGDDAGETFSATYYSFSNGELALTVEFNEDGTVVFTPNNPYNPTPFTANYKVVDGAIKLYDTESGNELYPLAAYIEVDENGVPVKAGYNGYDYVLSSENVVPEPEKVEITLGDNTVPVTGDSNSMTIVTFVTDAKGVYTITLGENAVLILWGETYFAGDKVTVSSFEAGEEYEYKVNSESMEAGAINLTVTYQAPAEADPTKDAVIGSHKVGDYMVEIFRNDYSGIYYATITTSDYSVNLQFTFDVTDNGENSYTLTNLVYVEQELGEAGVDRIDEIAANDWTFSIDPVKESLIGEWIDVDGYSVSVMKEEGVYLLSITTSSWDASFYFTYDVVDNGDGTFTLKHSYVENLNEFGDKEVYLDAMLALVIVFDNPNAEDAPTLEGEGTSESPYIIVEPGDYVAPYAGGYVYPYFQFTATENGYVTISSLYEYFNLQYGKVADTPNNNLTADGYLSEVKIYLQAGTTVYFNIADNQFPSEGVEIPFTLSFEAFESDDPSFLEGNWIGTMSSGYSSIPYTFTIKADGTGTGSYTRMGRSTSFIINYILVDGENVVINATTTGGYYAEELEFTFTYDEENDVLNGDMKLEKGKYISLESMQINGSMQNGKYTYIANAQIIVEVSVGATIGSGSVSITYTVNGGEAVSVASNSKSVVSLNSGDTLVITVDVASNVYTSLSLAEVFPEGHQKNPIVIDQLPYEMSHLASEQEKYYTYTAKEAIVLTITCPAGCYVSGDAGSKNGDGNYVVTLSAGQKITLNPWTSKTEGTFTYTITGEAPVVVEPEQPGEGGDGNIATYIGSNGSRGMKVEIDIAADTIVITRAKANSLTDFGQQTSYTFSYSGLLALKNADGVVSSPKTTAGSGSNVSAIEFDADGLVVSITWMGVNYVDYVKQ